MILIVIACLLYSLSVYYITAAMTENVI